MKLIRKMTIDKTGILFFKKARRLDRQKHPRAAKSFLSTHRDEDLPATYFVPMDRQMFWWPNMPQIVYAKNSLYHRLKKPAVITHDKKHIYYEYGKPLRYNL
jgi:hypothetical protein